MKSFSLIVLVGCLLGCADAGDTAKAQIQYDVDLRWTSYGIPHVKANDWAALALVLPMRRQPTRYV